MKKTKRIIVLVLSIVMMLTMGMTAFGASINITGGNNKSEYAAYKLLNATVSGVNSENVAYSVNEKYLEVLKNVSKLDDETKIMDYIYGLTEGTIREFADKVYIEIKRLNIPADYIKTPSNNEFKNVDLGYYIIAETKKGDSSDTYSLVMGDTVNGDIDITTKESVPTLEKKVQEKNDSTDVTTDWQDGADYDLGDKVPFKLTGTLPSNYDNYKTYYYAFHDTMSKGLTFNADSVVVKVDNNIIDPSNYSVITTGLDKETFKIEFKDLKKITGATVTSSSKITVLYNATLNSNALTTVDGNENTAHLEYGNDPYYAGSSNGSNGPTSSTPEDTVIVFTHKIIINKIDGDGNKLEGAGFTLYKKIKGEYVQVREEIKGVTTFEFTHLDAGDYKIVETTVPDGYNKAKDIEFTITAEYSVDLDDPIGFTLAIDGKNGKDFFITQEGRDVYATINIKNLKGIILPNTGGIGTVLFYIVGIILMAGSLITIIARRRMTK